MALSALDDKSHAPEPAELERVLGRSAANWNELTRSLASEYPPLDQAWGFDGAKWGWSLRLRQKKRTVLYMTPCRGHFLVGFALGEKAVKAARASRLPRAVQEAIDGAKKYVEGRGVRLEIRGRRDLPAVMKIAAAKMST